MAIAHHRLVYMGSPMARGGGYIALTARNGGYPIIPRADGRGERDEPVCECRLDGGAL